MGSKLYVGNLPFNTTDADLEEVFSQYGVIESANVISDRETGRSRGFGFVKFEDEAAAKSALSLDGTQMGGRALKVNEAQERTGGPSRGNNRR